MQEIDPKPEKTGKKVVDTWFKSGEEWNGNASGRPLGSYSLKTKIINLLKEKPEIEKQLIADLLEKEQGLLMQMIDGRPKQDVSVEQKEAPRPILDLGNLTQDALNGTKEVPRLEKP